MDKNTKAGAKRISPSRNAEETKRPVLALFSRTSKRLNLSPRFLSFLLFNLILVFSASTVYPQTVYQPNTFTPNQPYTNYMANSGAFNQEIARMEINVVRRGKAPMSITEVPRLDKGDVLKVRLLEEQVNGLKPDQSNFDWTFLVAFINPGRNTDKESSVSEEIQFRKSGWYKEYSFAVPYDSQPIFFLYPKPEYRSKLLNLINKNPEEIRKIGEKTLEIAGAYAKIGSFINELQSVMYRTSYGNYGGFGGYGSGFGGNRNSVRELAVESLAKSFNIALPSCWGGGNSYGGYGNYNSYGAYGASNYMANDFAGRVQCVAKSVRLEDFDLSVSRLLQQGGILALTQLSQRFPQIAHWINIAAVALDLILKITRKTPLKIVPTVISTAQNQAQNFAYQQNFGYQNGSAGSGYVSNSSNNQIAGANSPSVKISLYAESQPRDNGFITAYPIVLQKWQANPDPETISLPTPVLAEPCLHAGQNILRSTDLVNDWMSDTFTKDFKLVVSAPNGFRKEFPLKKNSGMGGWELNITQQDLQSFPKISMTLDSEIVGKRGFNEIRSPKFDLPLAIAGTWEVDSASQKAFAAGGKRTVTLRNQLGSCKCLQAVVFKPSFGGQFVFEAGSKENELIFSEDGKEVSFEVDATFFQPGQGKLELHTYGGDMTGLGINLYPSAPSITGFKMSKGDRRALVTGERLEQIRSVKVNGKRMIVSENSMEAADGNRSVDSNVNQNGLALYNPNPSPSLYASPVAEMVVSFEDPNSRLDSNTISLEIELEGGRSSQAQKTFAAAAARPSIITGSNQEVQGVLDAAGTKFRLNLRNALTDFNFKAENIQIETRIVNGNSLPNELPEMNLEAVDWKSIRMSFVMNERVGAVLAGGRLQFRIVDSERGESDWYTVQRPSSIAPKYSAKGKKL